MKTPRTDAGGIAGCEFSRHQVETAAPRSLVRLPGKSSRRLGGNPVWQSSVVQGLKQRRPQMRQAIQRWCFTHAHTAWKTLVVACAAVR